MKDIHEMSIDEKLAALMRPFEDATRMGMCMMGKPQPGTLCIQADKDLEGVLRSDYKPDLSVGMSAIACLAMARLANELLTHVRAREPELAAAVESLLTPATAQAPSPPA